MDRNILFIKSLKNWEIIFAFTKREIQVRYKGSRLGIAWSLINPLMMLGVYTLVFSQIFQAKWGGDPNQTSLTYGLNIFTGLIIFNIFAESISKAPTQLVNNPNYIKKVIFPVEVLGIASVGSAVANAIICIALLLGWNIITSQGIWPSIIALPLMIGPYILIVLGCVWVVSAIGVIVRDISQAINAMISILMFMSPIFYSKEALPKSIGWIMTINPIAFTIENTRNAINYSDMVRFEIVIIWWIVGIILCETGFRTLQKTRDYVGDYL